MQLFACNPYAGYCVNAWGSLQVGPADFSQDILRRMAMFKPPRAGIMDYLEAFVKPFLVYIRIITNIPIAIRNEIATRFYCVHLFTSILF